MDRLQSPSEEPNDKSTTSDNYGLSGPLRKPRDSVADHWRLTVVSRVGQLIEHERGGVSARDEWAGAYANPSYAQLARTRSIPVSYTHLTLPTNREV